MKKGLIIAIAFVCFVVAAFLIGLGFGNNRQETANAHQVQYMPATMTEYPSLASVLARRINQISPTRSIDGIGWMALRISFVTNAALAYIEYTDTHVTLRILVQYGKDGQNLITTVLATFIPVETGGWQLQYGRDAAAGLPVINYRFNGDAKQWIPEAASL
jgi:D-alanyl-lipoteichoic acid acyltransferase DltB (MBOAT superfamily)